jgi:AcrR family transcriptional regulator
VYRRFKDRHHLVRGLLRRIAVQIRVHFEASGTVEKMAETYVEYALRMPHEYELFYSNVHQLSSPQGAGRPRPIGESRPNFAFVQQQLAKELGGPPERHTHLALAIWTTLHGTAALLLSRSIPHGHEEELREACRTAVRTLLEGADKFSEVSRPRRRR